MSLPVRSVAALACALALLAATSSTASDESSASSSSGQTLLVSRPSGNTALADAHSFHTTISGTGRFVTFMSEADNLVPGDDNNQFDIFVRDATTGTTVVASRSSGTGPPDSNGRSAWPAIAADGRYVAFQSYADNLVPGDTNGRADVFVRDLRTGTTQLVSRPNGSTSGHGNGDSLDPAISADGRFVAFQSFASNLVGGDTNGRADVFVRELRTGVTRLVSGPSRGGAADGEADNPALSAGGRYVAFESNAPNLAPGDRNHSEDVFLRDVRTGSTRLVSRAHGSGLRTGNGPSYMASISAGGRMVAFASRASDLVGGDTDRAEDVFVSNMDTGVTRLVSVRRGGGGGSGNDRTIYPSISADGRYVAFHSDANDLVPGDSNHTGDVFVRDLRTGTTSLVSRPSGSQTAAADNYSGGPSISADGRYVAFASTANDLVPGDTDQVVDIFRRQLP
jgi:Tol biopolymer transport system component